MNLRVLIIILYLHHNSHNEESVDVDVDMCVWHNKQQCIVIGLDQGGGRMAPNYNFHFISQSTVDI